MNHTPGYDGDTIVSTDLEGCQLILKIVNFGSTQANCRDIINKVFGLKSEGTLVTDLSGGIRKIKATVKSIVPSSFKDNDSFVITLRSASPFFSELEAESKIMSAVTPLFKFPFTFNSSFKFGERMASVIENFVNDSTVDVYPIIEFKAISALMNPSIMNINTYEKMKVNISLSAGEKLRIDTRIGKKSITKISGSEETNCFNCIADDFKFFKLYTGDNYLKYDADTNAAGLQTTVQWENLYGGV